MTFKTIAFVTVLASAVAMGACGKKDPLSNIAPKDGKLLGSCSFTRDDGVSLCQQAYVSDKLKNDVIDRATDAMKQECGTGKYSANGCSTSDALGGCKGTDANGVTQATVAYKGLTLEQIKAACAQNGLEFFQP